MLDTSGTFTYTPNDSSFAGNDSFTYRVSDGTSYAVAVATIQLANVSIVDEVNNSVSNNRQSPTTIWDGQQADLTGDPENLGNNEVAYSWNLTGNPIAGYAIGTDTTIYLDPAELSSKNLQYYYFNANGLENASLSVTISSNAGVVLATATTSTYLDVHQVTASVDINFGTVTVDNSNRKVEAGNTIGIAGIREGASLNADPSGSTPPGGAFSTVQVIQDTSVSETLNDGTQLTFEASNRVDGSSPYDGGNSTLQDSPYFEWSARAISYSRQDTFSDYVMYTPTGGIAVPVAKFEWGWHATITLDQNGVMQLDSTSSLYAVMSPVDYFSYPPQFIYYPGQVNQSFSLDELLQIGKLSQ